MFKLALILAVWFSLGALGGCDENKHVLIPVVPDTVRVWFQDGVSPTASYQGTRDAILKDGPDDSFRNGNFGATPVDTLGSAELSTGFYERRLIVRMDLSSIKNCSQVLSARLSIRIVLPTGGSMTLEAHRVIRPDWNTWVEGFGGPAQGVSWTTVDGAAPWTAEGGDFEPVAFDRDTVSALDTIATFSLSPALVKSWILKPQSNHGVIMRTTDVSRALFARAVLREYVDAAKRPRLDVAYIKGP